MKMIRSGKVVEGDRSADADTKPGTPPQHPAHRAKFIDLYRRCSSKIAGNLRATYGPGPPDPDDVAQRAFETLNKQENIDEIRDPEGFVWICARNIIMSEKRAQRVRSDNQDEVEQRCFAAQGDTFDPERVLMAREQLDLVMETLHQMPERRRQIFMLNRVHGLTPKEAGQRCGVSRSAAVRHIALATSQIAKALAESSTSDTVEQKKP